MEGRNKKLLLSLLVLVLLVSIGKETYALFTNEVSSIVQNYGTGTLKLSYSNTSINLDNAYPMTDEDGMNQSDSTITITNTGTLAYKFNVILDPSSDSTISSDLIRVSMDGENPAALSTDSNIIIRDVILNPGSSRTFTIKLWIPNTVSSSDILNKKFSASLTSTGIAVKNMEDSNGTVLIGGGPLYDYIKNNADTTTQIDFNQTSEQSNTNGIYTTTNTDSGNPVYYYRGNVDNHVLFANMCWRIVRTTETGGVKLIYDGVPSNGQCNNRREATIIGSSAFNENGDSPAYVGYMYGTVYTPIKQDLSALSGSIVFGNDITYANGTYTLKDTYTLTDVGNWSTEQETIASKYHYTCFTSGNTCQEVNYICLSAVSGSLVLYFELSDGKNHLDILKEMLNNSSNTNNSVAKTAVDAWYQANMTNYTSQLEDTVFCNDRSYDVSGTGYDKDATNIENIEDDNGINGLIFNAARRLFSIFTTNTTPTLVCQNVNDKFTVSSNKGNGALTYPVGLITADEIIYAGAVGNHSSNTSFYLYNYNGYSNWALSPYVIDGFFASEFEFSSYVYYSSVYYSDDGLRPVVSLKPGIKITGGSGTSTDPFVIAKPSLYDYIKSNADTTTTIDFSKTSEESSTNGIYTTTNTDSGNPIYYYRGNVDNRVIFANFCWRIVRTTETGGVKLIYDGVPSNGQCNNTGSNSTIGSSKFNTNSNDNAYVGYMFGTAGSSTYASTHANTNDSTIKGVIDTWYHDNMTSYTSQLEDAVWCNDRSVVTDLMNSNGGYYSSYTTSGYGKNNTLYGPASRVGYKVSNPTPTLKCAQDNDKFTVNTSNGNGALTYPVGLITADEMTYAGGKYYSSSSDGNSSFYLYTGQEYWALSPYTFYSSNAYEFSLFSTGRLCNFGVTTSTGVRPSVSLQPGIAMTGGGSGTSADPFVIG